jgi:phosphopantothenate synthetase
VLHEPAGEREGRLDIVVADVVAVGLEAHDRTEFLTANFR